MTEEPLLEDQRTGEQYAVVERRRRHILWLGLSTWQWAVIGAYIIALVLFVVVGAYTHRIDNNTRALKRSICAQALYLDGLRSPRPLVQKRTDKLVHDLRALARCPPPPPPVNLPPG